MIAWEFVVDPLFGIDVTDAAETDLLAEHRYVLQWIVEECAGVQQCMIVAGYVTETARFALILQQGSKPAMMNLMRALLIALETMVFSIRPVQIVVVPLMVVIYVIVISLMAA
jgi:hypothetical protein